MSSFILWKEEIMNIGQIFNEPCQKYSLTLEEVQKNRAELERSKRYLKYIFDYAPVGYVILNNDGFIRDANITALAYFGYEKEFFLDFQLKNFITADT